MALIEKDIADDLIALRQAMSLGTEYVRADDLEKALQRHLDAEQHWRTLHAWADAVTNSTVK